MIPSPPESTPRPEALTLPRPNPGPEPWRDGSAGSGWPWAAIAAAAIVVAGLARSWRRRSQRRMPLGTSLRDDSPIEDRLLSLCDSLRFELAESLGPALLARTTEELATDPRVGCLLGDDLPRFVEILAEGDRLKFARRSAPDLADRLPAWTAWVASRGRPHRGVRSLRRPRSSRPERP